MEHEGGGVICSDGIKRCKTGAAKCDKMVKE